MPDGQTKRKRSTNEVVALSNYNLIFHWPLATFHWTLATDDWPSMAGHWRLVTLVISCQVVIGWLSAFGWPVASDASDASHLVISENDAFCFVENSFRIKKN